MISIGKKAIENLPRQKGFSLLEVLVAILLFAIIISMLFTPYSTTLRNIEDTESKADIYQMARIALERIVEDLESSFIPKSTRDSESEGDKALTQGFLGEQGEIEGRSADSLRFNSRAHLAFSEDIETTERATIAYFVKESDRDDTLVLYRSDTPEFQPLPEEGEGGLVICDRINAVDFTFYDDKGEAHDSWDSTDELFKHRLPIKVSVLLEFANSSDPESPLKFITAVTLPLASEEYGKKGS